MNRTFYKYTLIISVLLMSVLVFFNWFVIEAGGVIDEETHSFMTIPTLVNHGAETLSKLSTVGVAVTLMILCGILKYLCILSSALGIWGVILTFMKDKRSRLINASQMISTMLIVIALVVILAVNILSRIVVGGTVYMGPTLWFVIFALSLILSYICGYMISRQN